MRLVTVGSAQGAPRRVRRPDMARASTHSKKRGILPEPARGAKIPSSDSLIGAEQTVQAKDDHLYHFEVFLNNLRNRKAPVANPETCFHATTLGHLMNISWETGRSIRWDGTNLRVIDDPAAQKLVLRPYRAPWKLEV